MNDDTNQRAREALARVYDCEAEQEALELAMMLSGPAPAITAITSARGEALREAAEKARQTKSYDDMLQRGAGCPTVGERIAASILSLITGGGERG